MAAAGVKRGEDVLTTGHIAKLFGHAPRTVQKWIDRGALKGWRIPESGDRRVRREDLIAFAAARGMPLPECFARRAGPVAAGLPAGWGGLEAVDGFELGRRAARGELSAVAVGCGDGFGAAVGLGRRLRAFGGLRLALVLGPDRSAAEVPPGVFDRVFGPDDPPGDVADYLGRPLLAPVPSRGAAS